MIKRDLLYPYEVNSVFRKFQPTELFLPHFGDIHTAIGYARGMMSSTRGLIAGGVYCCPGVAHNTIEYVTISTTGDAVDFGDMKQAKGGYNGTTSDSHGGLSE